MIEFTGERVIPGEVNSDLWAEHFARYAFAARFAAGTRSLDVGCGAGYGTAELGNTASHATGFDISQDALTYARTHYPGPAFLQASAESLPFAPNSFDLITAFEVIEHLTGWSDLIAEARRVLTPRGVFLVSTPNTLYYAESRAEHGPNPYHTHEFEFTEFHDALSRVFPHVTVFLQNRLEAFAFYPAAAITGSADASISATDGDAAEANFFIGICTAEPLPRIPPLVHVPRASNLLREREQHIHLLARELKQNQRWLAETTANRDQLLQQHTALGHHVERQNLWALELEAHWKTAQQRIVDLQNELKRTAEGYERQVAHLDDENRKKTAWALNTEARLTQELEARAAHIAKITDLLDTAGATIVERTQWAQQLDADLARIRGQLRMIRDSRWVKLGRTIGIGPKVSSE